MYKITHYVIIIVCGLHFSLLSQEIDRYETAWKTLLKKNVLPQNDPKLGYCYQNKDGKISGKSTNGPVILASLSKIFTSIVSLKVLNDKYYEDYGPSKNLLFTTKLEVTSFEKIPGGQIYYNLYIKGGLDPYFDTKKLIWAISLLNERGIKTIENLIIDSGFYFSPEISIDKVFLDPKVSSYREPAIPTITMIKKSLIPYFNLTLSNFATLKKKMEIGKLELLKLEEKHNLVGSLGITVQTPLEMLTTNILSEEEFKSFQNIFEEKKMFTLDLYSAPFHKILKFMNSFSHNWISEILFKKIIGGIDQYKLLLEKLMPNLSSSSIFYTGSGLPLKNANGLRKNNISTCSDIIGAMLILKELEFSQDKITQFPELTLPNPNEDFPVQFLGDNSVISRGFYARSETTQKVGYYFIGKTGTLNNAINLALIAPTLDGAIPLILFNNDENALTSPTRERTKNLYFDAIQEFYRIISIYQIPQLHSNIPTFSLESLNPTDQSEEFLNISGWKLE